MVITVLYLFGSFFLEQNNANTILFYLTLSKMAGNVPRQAFSKGCGKDKRVKKKSGRQNGDENRDGKEVENS